MIFPTLRFLAAVGIAISMSACASNRLETVWIRASPEVAAASVRVDIAGSSPTLETIGVRDYWQPGNPVRASANASQVRFGSGAPVMQSVTVGNIRAPQVVVIADLPGPHSDGELRVTIPSEGKGVPKEVGVEISSGGVHVTMPAR